MTKLLVLAMFVIGVSGVALAAPPVPEISPTSGISAIALLSGALLMIRGRRKSGK